MQIPQFLSFKGRISRSQFWCIQIVCVGIGYAIDGLTLVTGDLAIAMPEHKHIVFVMDGFVLLPAALFALWWSVASTAKRLHDFGMSGWWTLGIYIPLYWSVFGTWLPELFLLMFGLAGSTPGIIGNNRYGIPTSRWYFYKYIR